MGLFDKLFGNKPSRDTGKVATERLIETIIQKTSTPFVKVKLTPGETGPLESKIGGMPYMPEGFEYPLDVTEGGNGRPLAFLAQLNFGEIPPLEGFPREGILQFYISDSENYGLNFEEPNQQKGFRVIFHKQVGNPATNNEVSPSALLPVKGEFRLSFEPGIMPITCSDFRFDKYLLEAYNEAFPSAQVPSVDRIPEERLDNIYDRLEAPGHRIGGYPDFVQIDPREYHRPCQEHTTLLFQITSMEEENCSIRWGDDGTCTFLIRPEDLAKEDFSNVIYNWDCY